MDSASAAAMTAMTTTATTFTMDGWTRSLASMLYIVDPRDPIDLAISYASNQYANILIFAFIEFVVQTYLHSRRQRRSNGVPVLVYQMNDAFSSLAIMVLEIQFMALAVDWLPTFTTWATEHRLLVLPYGTWTCWIISFLGYEFCYYWFHRCMHEINALWKIHWIHHNASDFNITVARRRHILISFVTPLFFTPLVMLGVPVEVILLRSSLNSAWDIWMHTRLIPKQHWLIEYIFNTPSHHRAHHGRNLYCIDKNFGGVLIIFDRIFGTFEPELDDTYPVMYNVTIPLRGTTNPIASEFWPLYELCKKISDTKPFYLKPFAALMGPGWKPELLWVRKGDPADIIRSPNLLEDPTAEERERHDPALPISIRVYLLANLALMLAAQFSFAESFLGLEDWNARALWFAYTACAAGSMGLVWDAVFTWGLFTECLRWIVTAATLICFNNLSDAPPLAVLLFCWSILSLVFCAAHFLRFISPSHMALAPEKEGLFKGLVPSPDHEFKL